MSPPFHASCDSSRTTVVERQRAKGPLIRFCLKSGSSPRRPSGSTSTSPANEISTPSFSCSQNVIPPFSVSSPSVAQQIVTGTPKDSPEDVRSSSTLSREVDYEESESASVSSESRRKLSLQEAVLASNAGEGASFSEKFGSHPEGPTETQRPLGNRSAGRDEVQPQGKEFFSDCKRQTPCEDLESLGATGAALYRPDYISLPSSSDDETPPYNRKGPSSGRSSCSGKKERERFFVDPSSTEKGSLLRTLLQASKSLHESPRREEPRSPASPPFLLRSNTFLKTTARAVPNPSSPPVPCVRTPTPRWPSPPRPRCLFESAQDAIKRLKKASLERAPSPISPEKVPRPLHPSSVRPSSLKAFAAKKASGEAQKFVSTRLEAAEKKPCVSSVDQRSASATPARVLPPSQVPFSTTSATPSSLTPVGAPPFRVRLKTAQFSAVKSAAPSKPALPGAADKSGTSRNSSSKAEKEAQRRSAETNILPKAASGVPKPKSVFPQSATKRSPSLRDTNATSRDSDALCKKGAPVRGGGEQTRPRRLSPQRLQDLLLVRSVSLEEALAGESPLCVIYEVADSKPEDSEALLTESVKGVRREAEAKRSAKQTTKTGGAKRPPLKAKPSPPRSRLARKRAEPFPNDSSQSLTATASRKAVPARLLCSSEEQASKAGDSRHSPTHPRGARPFSARGEVQEPRGHCP